MKKIGNGLALFFLFITVIAQAKDAVSVSASVDRNEVGVGETFTYSISVSSESSINVTDPRLPQLDGFELINSWTGSESRSTFTNGKFEVQQSRHFNYMLAASRQGEITIAASQVVVEGKTYATQPIKIKVLPQGQIPPQAQNQGQGSEEETGGIEDVFNRLLRRHGMGGGQRTQPIDPQDSFFIQLDVDKTSAVVGEQVTASWYLYTRGQVHDIDTLKYPSLGGFWKEEIELATRLNFQPEVVNGITYQKALLVSYALFPIKPGKINLDAYKAKCTVSVPVAFGFPRPMQFTKSSQVVEINVSELPKANQPTNYSGAVGQFTAQAKVEQATVANNQPLIYVLRFEGRGNAKLIDLPKFSLPQGMELYDTKQEAKFFREGTSFKEFKYTIIPRVAGATSIPETSVSGYDPVLKKYYEIKVPAVALNVLPGVGQQALAGQSFPGAENGMQQIEKKNVLPDLVLNWEARRSPVPGPGWLYWVIVYIGVFVYLTWYTLVAFGVLARRNNTKKILRHRLQKIERFAQQENWRKVGTEGTNLVYQMLGLIQGEGGTGLEIGKSLALVAPSLRQELETPLTKLMNALEMLSFAPEEIVGNYKQKSNLLKLTAELDVTLSRVINAMSKTADEKILESKA